MGKTSKRVKAAAAAYPVPQSKADVDTAIQRLGECQRERDRITASMGDELARVKAEYEAMGEPLKREIEALANGVQIWCESHRDELTGGGKRKFYRFAAGEVMWRMRPPKVAIRGMAAVIERLQQAGIDRFLRTKIELDKERMLAEPRVAAAIEGVRIEQSEDFAIVPFSTELEQVA